MRDLTHPDTRERAERVISRTLGGQPEAPEPWRHGARREAEAVLDALAEAGITLVEGATVERAAWADHGLRSHGPLTHERHVWMTPWVRLTGVCGEFADGATDATEEEA